METILPHLVNAIAYAFILFLVASGLSLVFGVMGIVNLAHGALYMLGAYIGITAAGYTSSYFFGLIVAMILVGMIGLVLERLFLCRLYKYLNEQVLVTIGLIYIFENIVLWVWGPVTHIGRIPAVINVSIKVAGFGIPLYRLILIGVGIVVYLGLFWLHDKTRIGAVIRAGMDDKEMTLGLGINFGLVSTLVFALGALIGGAAGFMGAPVLGAYPGISMSIVLLSFVVVVVGGVGSVHGTLVGSLIIGLADNLGKAYLPDMAMFIIYFIFITMLLIRPSGLLGRKQLATISSYTPPAHAAEPPVQFLGPALYTPYLIAVGAMILILTCSSNYIQSLLAKMMIFGIFAMSFNLLAGYTGLVSMGHAAFFGVAGYTTAILSVLFGIDNFWITASISLLVTMMVAVVYGFLSLRVSGMYFFLVTLGLGELLYSLAMKWRSVTRGEYGLPGVPLPNLHLPFLKMDNQALYVMIFITFLICLLVMYRFIKSPAGLVLQGIRDNESRMSALGYHVWRYKFAVFIVAGFFAGVAGVLFTHWCRIITPMQLQVSTSFLVVLMAFFGSDRLAFGPVLGAFLIVFLEQLISLIIPQRWPLILGVGFIAVVMFLRGGVGIHLIKLWRMMVPAKMVRERRG